MKISGRQRVVGNRGVIYQPVWFRFADGYRVAEWIKIVLWRGEMVISFRRDRWRRVFRVDHFPMASSFFLAAIYIISAAWLLI